MYADFVLFSFYFLQFIVVYNWVIPFEMGHSHPGDHLHIAWNFNTLFMNSGCVQNFT